MFTKSQWQFNKLIQAHWNSLNLTTILTVSQNRLKNFTSTDLHTSVSLKLSSLDIDGWLIYHNLHVENVAEMSPRMRQVILLHQTVFVAKRNLFREILTIYSYPKPLWSNYHNFAKYRRNSSSPRNFPLSKLSGRKERFLYLCIRVSA